MKARAWTLGCPAREERRSGPGHDLKGGETLNIVFWGLVVLAAVAVWFALPKGARYEAKFEIRPKGRGSQ